MINTSRLTTVADVEAAMVNAEKFKADFQFKRTALERQLNNATSNSGSVSGDLAKINFEIASLEAVQSTLPPGLEFDAYTEVINNFKVEKQKLIDDEQSEGPLGLQRRVVLLQLLKVRIDGMTAYQTSLEQLKAQLQGAA